MVKNWIATTAEEVREALGEGQPLRLTGTDTLRHLRIPADPGLATLELKMAGIINHQVDDQVVTCHANTSLEALQQSLMEKGQCIPYLPKIGRTAVKDPVDLSSVAGTLAGHLSMNLPHSFESACGTWKDWLLGANVLLSTGLEAKCGSKVVKSVAGYDIHKLLIGSRGWLCVLLDLTLRTWPVPALPERDEENLAVQNWSEAGLMVRTLPSDYRSAVDSYHGRIIAAHPGTSTLYLHGARFQTPIPREGWVMGWGQREGNLAPFSGTTATYLAKAKSVFDPNRLLNPGELPITTDREPDQLEQPPKGATTHA